MFEFMTAMKALADPNRVRVLCMLEGRELCVCQIIEVLGLAPSTVSKHLSILRQARLLEDRKEGRWMYYRYPHSLNALAGKILELLKTSLWDEAQVKADRDRVDCILCMDKEDLCRLQTHREG